MYDCNPDTDAKYNQFLYVAVVLYQIWDIIVLHQICATCTYESSLLNFQIEDKI